MARRIIIIEDDGNTGLGISPYQGLFDNGFNNQYDPCTNCSNNPKNNPNASGICCCALPDLYRGWNTAPQQPVRYEYHTTCSFDNINLN